MPAHTPEARRLASSVAAIEKHHGSGDPRLPELRRDLRAEKLAEHIRQVVDAAPALTAEQRAQLAGLLHGGDAA